MKYSSFAKMYYFSFFGGAAFFAYVAKYLSELGFSGSQIGLITAMGAFLAMIFKPAWGFISDKYDKTGEILIIAFSVLIILSGIIPFLKNYYMIMGVLALLYIFNSSMEPIQINMTLKSPFDFGKIRQWGSIGFAISVALTGFLIDNVSIYSIFAIYGISFLIAIFAVKEINPPKRESSEKNVKLKEIGHLFKNRDFVIFLLASFFIWGSASASGTFFALYFENIGGNMSGVGIAVLLFAGSEVPIMNYTERILKKVSYELVIGFAALLFLIRWGFYFFEPAPFLILATFILQGLSVGVYIVVSNNYIKSIVKDKYRGTALAIYGSIAGGLATMVYQYLSGVVVDEFGVNYIYALYSIGVLIGMSFILVLYVRSRRRCLKPVEVLVNC